jgi:hypothetical protein
VFAAAPALTAAAVTRTGSVQLPPDVVALPRPRLCHRPRARPCPPVPLGPRHHLLCGEHHRPGVSTGIRDVRLVHVFFLGEVKGTLGEVVPGPRRDLPPRVPRVQPPQLLLAVLAGLAFTTSPVLVRVAVDVQLGSGLRA